MYPLFLNTQLNKSLVFLPLLSKKYWILKKVQQILKCIAKWTLILTNFHFDWKPLKSQSSKIHSKVLPNLPANWPAATQAYHIVADLNPVKNFLQAKKFLKVNWPQVGGKNSLNIFPLDKTSSITTMLCLTKFNIINLVYVGLLTWQASYFRVTYHTINIISVGICRHVMSTPTCLPLDWKKWLNHILTYSLRNDVEMTTMEGCKFQITNEFNKFFKSIDCDLKKCREKLKVLAGNVSILD